MNTHSRTTTNLKQQVHQLIEQLPAEQLPTLLSTEAEVFWYKASLGTWLASNS